MKFTIFLICIILTSFCDAAPSRQFYSQASQDEFTYTLLYDVLGKKDAGYYLEIGAGPPIYCNNTYFFEKNYGWRGISIDILDNQNEWATARKNPLLIEDATKTDYTSILRSFPTVIDYLSLDVDGSYDIVLEKLPLHEYIFKVITIEHDSYRYGDYYKDREREILSSFGYYLLCADVNHLPQGYFEDWWIHPSAFPASLLSSLIHLDLTKKEHSENLETIKSVIAP